MSDPTQDTKTEEPTDRRREQSRDEGQVVSSPDLQAGVQLLTGAVLLMLASQVFVRQLAGILTGSLGHLPGSEWTAAHTVRAGGQLALDLQRVSLPFVLVVLSVGLLAAVGQSGPIRFVTLKVDWSRIHPGSGWKRLMSWESSVRGLLAIGKASLIAFVAIALIIISRARMAGSGFRSYPVGCETAWELSLKLLLLLAALTLVLGVLDFGFKWFRHEQQLKMSRQDLKDEQKDDSGDPQLKARLRKLQRDAAASKGLDKVPEATVVLTNPTHLSIALKYEHGVTSAPVVLAKGEGYLALRIREIAAEHGIVVMERKPLVRALYGLVEVGREIPFEFYQAIAEILTSLYRLRGRV